MADPITAGIGIGSTVLGGIIGAAGSRYAGQAQANMYNYQAGVARINAQIAKQNADYESAVGEVQAQQAGIATRQTVGMERVSFGAGNIDVNTGSAAQVQHSELAVGQDNQMVIRANAARRAYGAEVQGAMDTAQAGMYGVAADTSITTGDIGAFSSLIGTAGSVSSRWIQGRQLGMFALDGGSTNILGV